MSFEKLSSLVAGGILIVAVFAMLIDFQPTKEISAQVISDPGISYSRNYSRNYYYIKDKTKLYKVDAKNFFKKSTSNKNLNNKIRLTITRGTIVPVSNFTVTQYVYHG